MAPSPWPDYQCTEPKAPDKNADNIVPSSSLNDSALQNASSPIRTAGDEDKDSEDVEIMAELKPQVSALDELGLKALLDEAMSFRLQEDVEGKSNLFKGLLEEVNLKAARTTTVIPKQNASSGKSNKKHKVRRNHQDEPSVNTKHKSDQKHSSKSDKTKIMDNEDHSFKDSSLKKSYDNSKSSVVDSGNLDSDRVNSDEADDLMKKKKASRNDNTLKRIDASDSIQIQGSFESQNQNIEMGDFKIVKADSSKNLAVERTHSSNKELSYTFSYKERNTNTKKHFEMAFSMKLTPIDSDDRNDLPSLERVNNGGLKAISTLSEEACNKNKKIDENGNAVSTNKEDARKPKTRRVKAKNKNTIMSQNIEGFRGDNDIETLVSYILSNNGTDEKNDKQSVSSLNFSKQSRVTQKIKHLSREESSETSSRKGKKSKYNKFQKSNSLEEVSTSKLEDLTCSAPKSLENPDCTNVSDYETDVFNKTENSDDEMNIPTGFMAKAEEHSKSLELKKDSKYDLDSSSDMEFHIVTKRHRKKKRILMSQESNKNIKNSSSGHSKMNHSFNENCQGRKDNCKNPRCHGDNLGWKPASSVPPSDKSADSSDVDSVHSLPVSSSTSAIQITSSNDPISLTSYADITRCVASPPKGGSTPALNKSVSNSGMNPLGKAHCVSSEEIPCVTLPIPKNRSKTPSSLNLDIDKEYPPLKPFESKSKPDDMFVEFIVQLPKPEDVPKTDDIVPILDGVPKSDEVPEDSEIVVEETVSIKVSSEPKTISESTTMSLNLDNSSKRPPVILMNEKAMESGGVDELVFGFEVNQQLLIGNSNEAGNQDTGELETESEEVNCKKEIEVTAENDPSAQKDVQHFSHNFMEIIDYISSEWSCIMEEMNSGDSKVQYFQ